VRDFLLVGVCWGFGVLDFFVAGLAGLCFCSGGSGGCLSCSGCFVLLAVEAGGGLVVHDEVSGDVSVVVE